LDDPDGTVVGSEDELNNQEVTRREGSTPLNARQRVYGLQKRKAAPSFLTASPKDRSSKPAAGDTQGAETDQNSTDSESERE
jgi:hypothetical protein